MTKPQRQIDGESADGTTPNSSEDSTEHSARAGQRQARSLQRRGEAVKDRTQRIMTNRELSFVRAVVKRFFEIGGTRQAMLVAFNMFIGFFPLVIFGLAAYARHHPGLSVGQRIVRIVGLDGEAATIVGSAFPSNDRVLLGASLISVLSCALSGLDVAGGVSEAFSRAWNVPSRKGWTSPIRGIGWFGLVMAQFSLILVVTRSSGRSAARQHIVGIPLLLLAVYCFWLMTPRLLLNKPLHRRDLRAGALVGVAGTAFLGLFTQFVLPGWFNSYAEGFGGVALAVTSFLYVVGIVWILIVVIGAVIWERNAPLDDVVEFATAADDETAEERSTDIVRDTT